jgi:hypothetical protein
VTEERTGDSYLPNRARNSWEFMSDTTLRSAEALILMALAVSFALLFALRRLRGRRTGFTVGLPILVGVALRLIAVVAINATGLSSQLRGGDETTFLDFAGVLANSPWGRGFVPHGPYQLQTVVFAIQIKLFHPSDTAMRVTQIGIATLGFLLILAAVYDLAGPRAARYAAWLIAFEPSNLFFNSALHKDPLMVLASGLVVLGGTKIWQHLDINGVFLAGLGCFIGIETRAYAGWFLVSATVLLLLHSALRRLDRPGRATPIIYAVVLIAFLSVPTVLTVTSNKSLQTLQQSQNANSAGATTGGSSNGDNLADEQVDFSTRSAVITNLPKRMFDLIFQPYPWQLQDPSQQLGAVGSLVALAGLFFLFRYAWRARGHILSQTAPLLYPFFFLLIAYSLSAGNAGTGFRYRSHLVLLGAGMLGILREQARRATAESRELASVPDPTPQRSDSELLPVS